MTARPLDNAEKPITTTCSFDCGSRCFLQVHLRSGEITRISTENQKGLHLKACPKGLAQSEVCSHSNRLTQPMKRTGQRGEGAFKPISWDEALDTVAEKIQDAIAHSGTESLYVVTNTGSMATLHNTASATRRFFGLLGKCTTTWGDPSYEGALQSAMATFGTDATGSTRDNLLLSRLILLWGWNPLVTRFGPDTMPYLAQAKKRGARIVCVDPRQSQTCQALADEWIPIKPGTDTAMLIAMAHVMMLESRLDEQFIETYTHGFDQFSAYVRGDHDGIPKDPAWAETICGTPAQSIADLARAYAEEKPAALMTGWAPGRTARGEQFHRAASTLAAITGNMGIAGGHSAGGPDYVDIGLIEKALPVPEVNHHEIHFTGLYDALLDPEPASSPSACRLLYIAGCNLLNQNLNLNKGTKALMAVDYVVTHELFLTPTARYADMVLPVSHFLEREDVGQPFIGGPYCIHMQKVLDPPHSVKSDLQIFSELAQRMGIDRYNDCSEAEWLRSMLDAAPGFPNLDTLRNDGVHHFTVAQPKIAFRDQIERPEHHPFPTPSGKIEIYSRQFAENHNAAIPPIPTYLTSWEGADDPLTEKYPIQLVSPHAKARANSQFDNIDAIKKLGDDRLWINTKDAGHRNIKDGDAVYVFNLRGRMRTIAKVTQRIMPGVASIDQGQWYTPDDAGIDVGGCANILTNDKQSPGGAFPSNTCLVQIEKCTD
jgi:anaerobic dimethyl sulfoxide reductase subunit A